MVIDRRTRVPDLGPVVLLVDTSASMQGEPELFAKALALALVKRLVPQGRQLHVVQFGGANEIVEFRVDRTGLTPLLAFLARSFHGRTDFDTALDRALDLAKDVVFVTDGKGSVSPSVAERARRANVQVVVGVRCERFDATGAF